MEASLDRAVITVPAYFNDAQRQATLEAGHKLGSKSKESFMSQPRRPWPTVCTASRKAPESVYDLGGGTFDITILEMVDGVFKFWPHMVTRDWEATTSIKASSNIFWNKKSFRNPKRSSLKVQKPWQAPPQNKPRKL